MAAAALVQPLSQRVCNRLSISPPVLGALVAALLFAASLGLSIRLGWFERDVPLLGREFWTSVRGWYDAVQAVIVGAAIGAVPALLNGARRDLAAIRPVARWTEGELAALQDSVTRFPRSTLRLLDLLTVSLGLVVNFLPGNWPDGYGAPELLAFTAFRTALLIWAVARMAYVQLVVAYRFYEIGRQLPRVDLLERRSVAAFGQHGLRAVIAWMGLSALFAVLYLGPFGRSPVTTGLAATLGVGLLSFLGPSLGVRRRQVEERDEELERVRGRIRMHIAAAPTVRVDSADSLADLLAWESRLERAPVWPIDASTLGRLALYIALGLASWIGAALVERLLGAALGA
jgi:hypothetical protein